eukprot:scaffold200456_cov30-Tisochrysis_lutea.AAC.1
MNWEPECEQSSEMDVNYCSIFTQHSQARNPFLVRADTGRRGATSLLAASWVRLVLARVVRRVR